MVPGFTLHGRAGNEIFTIPTQTTEPESDPKGKWPISICFRSDKFGYGLWKRSLRVRVLPSPPITIPLDSFIVTMTNCRKIVHLLHNSREVKRELSLDYGGTVLLKHLTLLFY